MEYFEDNESCDCFINFIFIPLEKGIKNFHPLKKVNPQRPLHKGSSFLVGEMHAVLLVWFVSLATMRDAGSLMEMESKLFKTLKVIKETMV